MADYNPDTHPQLINGEWRSPGYNTRPHPPGVDWRTCKRRNKGCAACEAELEAEGYFAAERQYAEEMRARAASAATPEQQAEIERFVKRITRGDRP